MVKFLEGIESVNIKVQHLDIIQFPGHLHRKH